MNRMFVNKAKLVEEIDDLRLRNKRLSEKVVHWERVATDGEAVIKSLDLLSDNLTKKYEKLRGWYKNTQASNDKLLKIFDDEGYRVEFFPDGSVSAHQREVKQCGACLLLEEKINDLQYVNNALEQNIREKSKDVEWYQRALNDIVDRCNELEKVNAQLHDINTGLYGKSFVKSIEENEDLKQRIKELSSQLESANKGWKGLQKTYDDLGKNHNKLYVERKELLKENTELKNSIKENGYSSDSMVGIWINACDEATKELRKTKAELENYKNLANTYYTFTDGVIEVVNDTWNSLVKETEGNNND